MPTVDPAAAASSPLRLLTWACWALIILKRASRQQRCRFASRRAWEASRSHRAAMGSLIWWRSRSQLATSPTALSFTPSSSSPSSFPSSSFSPRLSLSKASTIAPLSVIHPPICSNFWNRSSFFCTHDLWLESGFVALIIELGKGFWIKWVCAASGNANYFVTDCQDLVYIREGGLYVWMNR